MHYKSLLSGDYRYLNLRAFPTASHAAKAYALACSEFKTGSKFFVSPEELGAEKFVGAVLNSVGTTPFALQMSGCAWHLYLGAKSPLDDDDPPLMQPVVHQLLQDDFFRAASVALGKQESEFARWRKVIFRKSDDDETAVPPPVQLLMWLEVAASKVAIREWYMAAKELGFSKRVVWNKTFGPQNREVLDITPANDSKIVRLVERSLDARHITQDSGIGFVVDMQPTDSRLAANSLRLEVFTQPPEDGLRVRTPHITPAPAPFGVPQTA